MTRVGKQTLTGDREVDKKLAEFDGSIRKAVSKATRAGAHVVAAAARILAPVDSGELEQSIKVRALKRSRQFTAAHGISAGARFRDAILPYYAAFIEFGTRLRRHKSGKSTGQVAEDSFLRESLFSNETRIRQVFIDTLRAWLKGFGK